MSKSMKYMMFIWSVVLVVGGLVVYLVSPTPEDLAELDAPSVPKISTGMQPGTARIYVSGNADDVLSPSQWIEGIRKEGQK